MCEELDLRYLGIKEITYQQRNLGIREMISNTKHVLLLQYTWYFEDEAEEPPREPAAAADQLSPAPAPSRDLLIHNVKKIEGSHAHTTIAYGPGMKEND